MEIGPADLNTQHDFTAAACVSRTICYSGSVGTHDVIKASTWGFGPADLDAYHDFGAATYVSRRICEFWYHCNATI